MFTVTACSPASSTPILAALPQAAVKPSVFGLLVRIITFIFLNPLSFHFSTSLVYQENNVHGSISFGENHTQAFNSLSLGKLCNSNIKQFRFYLQTPLYVESRVSNSIQ